MDGGPVEGFLREHRVPLSGNKAELVRKVTDIFATDNLERETKVITFQPVEYSSPNFNDLPDAG